MADVASGSFRYETGEADGVKYASRDFAGPTTTLAVVAKAGTRYQILPGFTEGLEKFAFKVGTTGRTLLVSSANRPVEGDEQTICSENYTRNRATRWRTVRVSLEREPGPGRKISTR